MKRVLLFIFFYSLSTALYAQQQGKVWAFGRFLGIDFNSGSPVLVNTAIDHQEGCASIADKNGNLLFYTDGDRIYNRNHVIMPNGVLFYGMPYPLFGAGPIWSGTQSAVIVPQPGDSMKYYVFSLASSTYGYLWYSVVDMSLDNGLGDVVPGKKNVTLSDQGTLSEKMTAVAGNNCNAWLMVHNRSGNEYQAYEITHAGIVTTPVVSSAVFPTSDIGVIKFSPGRRRMVSASYGGVYVERPKGLALYDFDPNTGLLSNAQSLDTATSYYGACFSGDNLKLYVTSGEQTGPWATANRNFFQFDLSLPTPLAVWGSKTWLGLADSDVKLAPDGKVYFGLVGTTNIGAVSFPDLAGVASNPIANVLSWFYPAMMAYGLPNDVVVIVDSAHAKKETVNACFRDSAVLEANAGGFNFIWDDGSNGLTRTVYEPGVYTVRFQSGCKELTDTFVVNLVRFPVITADSACAGAFKGRIIATERDQTNFNYTWTDAGGLTLLQQTSSTGSILDHVDPGSYTLRLTTTSGCDTTCSVPVYAYPEINVKVVPEQVKILYGDSIQVQASRCFVLRLVAFGYRKQ